MNMRSGTIGLMPGAALSVLAVVAVLLVPLAGLPGSRVWAGDAVTMGSTQPATASRMRKELRRLHAVRRSHRKELLALPGVVGVGTERRAQRAVITIYVTKDTPELRAGIESLLAGEPVEIIEQPRGFRAY